LKAAIDDLTLKVKEKNGAWYDIFIYQIDYAQDILGFFMSTNVMADLKAFSD
jgi:predicted dehydrogenase